MTTLSLRQQLTKIATAAGAPVSIPSSFFIKSKSLFEMMLMMEPPRIAEWTSPGESLALGAHDWTDNCQGIVSDGASYYVVSNTAKGVYRLDLDFQKTGHLLLPATGSHLGSLCYHDGKLYVPISNGNNSQRPEVWVINTNNNQKAPNNTLETIAIIPLPAPSTGYQLFGWCVINPWDGLLYSTDSSFQTSQIDGYDPANGFAFVRSIPLSFGVSGPAGGCISARGHLYLASQQAIPLKGPWLILAYTLLNGQLLGTHSIATASNEVECVSLFPYTYAGVGVTQVQVLLVENNASTDDVFMASLTTPDPSAL